MLDFVCTLIDLKLYTRLPDGLINLSAHQCDSLGDEASGKFEMDVHNEFVQSNLTLKFQ